MCLAEAGCVSRKTSSTARTGAGRTRRASGSMLRGLAGVLWAGGALAGAGVQQGDPRTAELGCEAGAQLSPLHAQGPLVGVRDPRDWAGPQESSQLPMASRVVCTQA